MIDDLCKVVIAELDIHTFVETGLFEGETISLVSRWFSELHPDFGDIESMLLSESSGVNPWNTRIPFPIFAETSKKSEYQLISVELDEERAQKGRALFDNNPNISIVKQSSEEFMDIFVDELSGKSEKREGVFFYLDAHWNEYWPIKEEIQAIDRLDQYVLCVDDFFVPGRPEFGFDVYQGLPCSWKTLSPWFRDSEVQIYYPFRSNRDNRGWVLIFKGYSTQSLSFLDSLPLWRWKSWKSKSKPQELRREARRTLKTIKKILTGRHN